MNKLCLNEKLMAGEEVTHPCGLSNKPDILSDSVEKKKNSSRNITHLDLRS